MYITYSGAQEEKNRDGVDLIHTGCFIFSAHFETLKT